MSANEMSAIEMADIENEMSESATTTAPRSLAACLGYDAEAAGDKDSTKLLTKAQRAGGSSSDESDNSENNLLSGDKEQRKGNRKAEFIGTHFLIFLIAGWALDFARPLVTHGSYSHFGLDTHAYPRLGDFMHFLYDLIMIALLYSLMSHSSMPPSTAVQHFTVAIMTHGMAFHLVGDAVQSRLVDMGVDTSLHVHETPLIEACSSAVIGVDNWRCHEGEPFGEVDPEWCSGEGLVTKMDELFENLYMFDEYIGHYMWFAGELFCFLLFFWGCFVKDSDLVGTLPSKLWYLALSPLPLVYFPYLFIEGQAWPEFLGFSSIMTARYFYMRNKGYMMDVNGIFMFQWWFVSLLVFVVWCAVQGVPLPCLLKFRVQKVPEYWESAKHTRLGFFKFFWEMDGHFYDDVDTSVENWGC
ncbi:hypothetical protein TrCOL_g3446 [Triparma columacea]|uniref:Uncharacterized protein n=1 Tax=Triparma columacea TaxID=722753 RepID=A0A9W7LBW7_9STRA|nr:hypothetical protein TrCOL_g3446 [Triparma columacea]